MGAMLHFGKAPPCGFSSMTFVRDGIHRAARKQATPSPAPWERMAVSRDLRGQWASDTPSI